MYLLDINWAATGIRVGQLLLSLSILVLLHEFGHYITARWFKCRVEKFYLFFDPWFSLVKKKIGETEYGIGWLPLGGYVKISGMVDESMDKSQLEAPAEPWEFRSKPAWQRLIIMVGGVTMNVLTAFVIYSFILMYYGEKRIENASLKYGVGVEDSLMQKIGFRNGDRFVSVNGEPVSNYYDVLPKLVVAGSAVVEREGQKVTVNLPRNLIGQLVEKKRSNVPLLGLRFPLIIGADTGKAKLYGLQRWDTVLAVNGVATPFATDVTNQFETAKGKQATLLIARGTDTIEAKIPIDKNGTVAGIPMIGKPESLDSCGILDYSVIKYGFFESFPAGIKLAISKLSWYIDQFKLILSPETEAYKGIGGFKAMGSVFAPFWDWESFWNMTALFSIILAFMNLLPIPALDGGHIVFTLVEMVSGRKPSQKFMEFAQVVGMVLLLGLMLYANGNDWFGWGRGK